jgi:hypothetical protein
MYKSGLNHDQRLTSCAARSVTVDVKMGDGRRDQGTPKVLRLRHPGRHSAVVKVNAA